MCCKDGFKPHWILRERLGGWGDHTSEVISLGSGSSTEAFEAHMLHPGSSSLAGVIHSPTHYFMYPFTHSKCVSSPCKPCSPHCSASLKEFPWNSSQANKIQTLLELFRHRDPDIFTSWNNYQGTIVAEVSIRRHYWDYRLFQEEGDMNVTVSEGTMLGIREAHYPSLHEQHASSMAA